MGTKIDGNTDSNSKQFESKESGTGTGSKKSNRNTGTAGTGTGTGTGNGTGTGTGNGTGSTKTVKTEKVSKVSVLENLPEVNIPEPAEPKKKRKYTKKVKEENVSFDATQISNFIVAVSGMVASREGMSHWLITETEAKQIAEPLSNIIAKSEQLKVLGEHADAFALVTACLMIFAPRLIITLQLKKNQKGVKSNGKPVNNDRKSTDSNKQVSRKDAITPTDDGKALFDAISPIQ